MKSREFIRKYLTPVGATLERKSGDHHIYRLPSGRTLVVPMGGSHTEILPYVVTKFERLMKEVPRGTTQEGA